MLSLNRAQILGNLTRDAEMRYTPNGQAVSHFGVATNRRWKNQDGTDGESVEFHNIVVWGKQAENVTPMLKKGGPVYVEGRIQTRSWEGQDGVKRNTTEINADTVIVLSNRGSSGNFSAPANDNPVDNIAPATPADSPTLDKKNEDEIDIDEIPF